jgi:hypothetical protein
VRDVACRDVLVHLQLGSLRHRIKKAIKLDPTRSWDDVVREIADGQEERRSPP